MHFRHFRAESRRLEAAMKALLVVGILILVLGLVSFFVPYPQSEHHGLSVGDAHVGVTTEHDKKVPLAASIVMCVVGAGLVLAGKSS
jgi:hypothetical protein